MQKSGQKILIYTVGALGGTIFGFGVGWLAMSFVILIERGLYKLINGDAPGEWIGYFVLLLAPVGCLVGIYFGIQFAKKISNTGWAFLSSYDKRKALAFIVSGLTGIAMLVVRIIQDS